MLCRKEAESEIPAGSQEVADGEKEQNERQCCDFLLEKIVFLFFTLERPIASLKFRYQNHHGRGQRTEKQNEHGVAKRVQCNVERTPVDLILFWIHAHAEDDYEEEEC